MRVRGGGGRGGGPHFGGLIQSAALPARLRPARALIAASKHRRIVTVGKDHEEHRVRLTDPPPPRPAPASCPYPAGDTLGCALPTPDPASPTRSHRDERRGAGGVHPFAFIQTSVPFPDLHQALGFLLLR